MDLVVSVVLHDNVLNALGLETAPIIFPDGSLKGMSVDDVLKISTYQSKLNPVTLAEGIVFRAYDTNGDFIKGFKAVSPDFLIKYKE